jgi:carboxyl-terminal processing protease
MFPRSRWFLTALVFCIAVTAVMVGRWSIQSVDATSNYEDLKKFSEVLTLIKKNYVEDVKTKDLVNGAIKGMVSSLDPHSGYMSPDSFKDFQTETKGEFGGLGIQIGVKDAHLTVIAPIEDTPAFRAGVKAGDKIVKIMGEPTRDMGVHEAVSKMRGPKGTSVTLTIFREGWKEPKDFTMVRDIIKIKSVKARMLKDGIGYIKLTNFQESTALDLSKVLDGLRKEGMSSLILDLRNDPGGLLNSAVDVAGQFLPPKKLVVYIKTRNGDKTEYATDGELPYYTDIPMVVLVNQGSASASEIVAGALKDWNRAVLIGVQTFGKGSVQSLVPLSDGSGLRITTAKYYTPKGTSIQGVGITPDIVVKLEAKNGEERTVIREKDLQRHLRGERPGEGEEPGAEEKAAYEVDEKDDTQLQRAIDTLKTWKVFESMKKAA